MAMIKEIKAAADDDCGRDDATTSCPLVFAGNHDRTTVMNRYRADFVN